MNSVATNGRRTSKKREFAFFGCEYTVKGALICQVWTSRSGEDRDQGFSTYADVGIPNEMDKLIQWATVKSLVRTHEHPQPQ